MSAEIIMNLVADKEGWNDLTKLDLCLEYIDNQKSDEAFKDFLLEKTVPVEVEPSIAIIDFEMTKDDATGVGRNRCEEKDWEGTVEYIKGDIKIKAEFKYNWFVGNDNGGDGGTVESKKPDNIDDDKWENIVAEIEDFLREDFAENRALWMSAE